MEVLFIFRVPRGVGNTKKKTFHSFSSPFTFSSSSFSLLRRRARKQNYHKKGVSALGRILKSFSSFANRSLLCGSGLMTPLDRMGGAASRELLRLEEEVDSSSSSTTITTHTPTAPE